MAALRLSIHAEDDRAKVSEKRRIYASYLSAISTILLAEAHEKNTLPQALGQIIEVAARRESL
jgi:hypothetical protein